MDKKFWQFDTREIIYSAIGIVLYGTLAWVTNFLQIPSSANVAVHPAVAIPMFFGVVFGPIVGFITGSIGYIIADLFSGYGFRLWWALGYGILGAIPGLIWLSITNFREVGNLIKVEIMVLLGVIAGMGMAALMEMWVSGTDYNTTFAVNFLPGFITNAIWGLILVPILLIVYSKVQT